MDIDTETLRAAGYTLLGAISGFVAKVVEDVEGDKVRPSQWFAAALGSGLVGYLIYLLCLSLGFDGPLIGVVVGLFGALGAKATIVVLKKFVFGKLGISEDAK